MTHPVITAPDQISYLDAAAASAPARRYKAALLAGLELAAGQRVADVGCGPGTDLAALADAVGPTGSVLGLDVDEPMLATARARLAGYPQVRLRQGDAHALPLPDAGLDRVRVDRVLQHLADPPQVLAELRRVLRPGGLLAMAEPDWDTLVVDDRDLATSRTFAAYLAERIRNEAIGRQLPRLAMAAGFGVHAVDALSVLFRDFAGGEQILGLERNTARLVAAGRLTETAARDWLDRLRAGPFLASFTFYTVVVRA